MKDQAANHLTKIKCIFQEPDNLMPHATMSLVWLKASVGLPRAKEQVLEQ